MGYSRPHGTVVLERLANYFLNNKHYELSLEQLTDVAIGISKPYYEGRTKNSDEVSDLRAYLYKSVLESNNKKKK